jgi:hypothetical protein
MNERKVPGSEIPLLNVRDVGAFRRSIWPGLKLQNAASFGHRQDASA